MFESKGYLGFNSVKSIYMCNNSGEEEGRVKVGTCNGAMNNGTILELDCYSFVVQLHQKPAQVFTETLSASDNLERER